MSVYKFADIAKNITTKKTPEPNDRFTYIGLEHLDSGKLFVNRYGSEVVLTGEKLVIKKGDILFGRRNTYLRRVAIAPFDGIFSAHGMVFRPNENVIDKDFFPFFISSDYFMDAAIRISVGSLSPTVNWKDLKVLEFELPTLEEQKRYAKILWAAEMLKRRYIVAIESAKTKENALINKLYVDANQYTKLKKYCELVKNRYNGPNTGLRALELECFEQGTGKLLNEFEEITGASSYTIFKKGDVLFGRLRPYLKKYFYSDFDGICCNEIWAIRANMFCRAKFLYYIISSDRFINYINAKTFGTRMPRADWKTASEFDVPDLTIQEQDEVLKVIEETQEIKKALIDSYDKLIPVQNSILNNIWQGE